MTAQVMALPASTAAGTASRPADSVDPPPLTAVIVTVDVERGTSELANVTSSLNGCKFAPMIMSIDH